MDIVAILVGGLALIYSLASGWAVTLLERRVDDMAREAREAQENTAALELWMRAEIAFINEAKRAGKPACHLVPKAAEEQS